MSRRWRRILMGLGITAVVLCACTWFFGYRAMMVFEARSIGKRSPIVREVPRPLPDSSISSATGLPVSYLGYSFEVPWDDLDKSRTDVQPGRLVLHFKSAKTLILSPLPPRHFVHAVVEPLTTQDAFSQMYGQASTQSDYAMWKLILEATPDKVSLFSSKKDAAGTPMLLIIKAVAIPEQSGIFSLQTKDFKGFQWGNPQSQPRLVVADLFADDGGLEFIFSGPGKGQPLGISQSEINRVLQTARRIRATQAASTLPPVPVAAMN